MKAILKYPAFAHEKKISINYARLKSFASTILVETGAWLISFAIFFVMTKVVIQVIGLF